MSGPYRDADDSERAETPRDEGIVGDVIAQFADVYAFYRELVQNSIDAGSPSVEVELAYDGDRMRVAVRDRGEGMTRDIVENQLLVLFRSTKEKDDTKIGKFGIGFASVLAPNPDVVTVQTSREGRRLTLHLYRDLSYELFDAGPATLTGTVVELTLAMKPREVASFVRLSREALQRWCRHATVPISFTAVEDRTKTTTRIDTPLGLASALVEVRRTFDDGQLTIVLGLGAPYVGFFNHGLMLYETGVEVRPPPLGHLAAKIQDARLGHTLSRDDVRRDEHFAHAIECARGMRAELAQACEARLRELADAGKVADVEELVAAVLTAELELASWWLPLVEPVTGSRIANMRVQPRAWAATQSSSLTAELAKHGIPVFRCSDIGLFAADVERAVGCKVRAVEQELTCVVPVERSATDEALLARLVDILDAVYRDPGAIVLAELIGLHADVFTISGRDGVPHVVDRDAAAKNPFALLARRPLVLSVAHPLVQAARAHDDPQLAASHLARAVLLQHRLLDADRSAKILDLALAATGAVE